MRAPLGARVADLRRDRVALLGARDPARERAGAEVDRRRGTQRLGPQRRALGSRCERLREAPLRLVEVDAPQPERPEGDAEAERTAGSRGEQRVERGAQVRGLVIEPRRVALPLGERERPGGVPLGDRGAVSPASVEPVARVEANRLEQAVAPLASAVVHGDERLLDEPREHVGAVRDVDAVAGADASRRR